MELAALEAAAKVAARQVVAATAAEGVGEVGSVAEVPAEAQTEVGTQAVAATEVAATGEAGLVAAVSAAADTAEDQQAAEPQAAAAAAVAAAHTDSRRPQTADFDPYPHHCRRASPRTLRPRTHTAG